MNTVGDLLDVPHPDDDLAMQRGRRRYEYSRFRATAYKTANYLRYNGVGDHATVAIVDDPDPKAVIGYLGTALLGGRVDVDPDGTVDAAVLLGPTEELGDYEVVGGCKRIGYGDEPTDPTWAYFEREIWSENPFFPKMDVSGEVSLTDEWTQAEGLRAARTAADDLTADDVVAVRGSLADPSVQIAGILAPLVAGATILFPSADQRGTVAVGSDDAPEGRVLDAPTDPPADD
ncbi:MAG: hypothetical protein ABEJ44_01580 [Halanaeroarchaeum sp.]